MSGAVTIEQINAWLLDPARTDQELIDLASFVQAQLQQRSPSMQTLNAIQAVEASAQDAEKKKFGA